MRRQIEDFYLRFYPFDVRLKDQIAYGYSTEPRKHALRDALYEANSGFCYYCYNRIYFDGRHYGQLEHSIEKGNVVNTGRYTARDVNKKSVLANCVHNLALACPRCNESLKRAREEERLICTRDRKGAEIILTFEDQVKDEKLDCAHCKGICEPFRELREKAVSRMHSSVSGSNILLQPDGIPGVNGQTLILYYDLIHFRFCPPPRNDQENPCTQSERKFIQNHISQFALNDPGMETKDLIRFLKDTVEQNGVYSRNYQNYIVEIFIRQKLNGKSRYEILHLCERLLLFALADRRDL